MKNQKEQKIIFYKYLNEIGEIDLERLKNDLEKKKENKQEDKQESPKTQTIETENKIQQFIKSAQENLKMNESKSKIPKSY